MEITFEAKLWLYEGAGPWYFLTLPRPLSRQIQTEARGKHGNWGTLRVSAQIGRTRWKTSLFRDRKRDAYLLPVKADIRRKEQLREGEVVETALTLDV